MKKIVSILLILLLIGCGSVSYKTIDATDAYALMKENNDVVVIDVREESEYTKEHIEGSINIPLGSIETIDIDKDREIIVYCLSGVRSQNAAEKLVSMGYTHVYNIDGGLINWGYELVKE